jgi:hypothetical protein
MHPAFLTPALPVTTVAIPLSSVSSSAPRPSASKPIRRASSRRVVTVPCASTASDAAPAVMPVASKSGTAPVVRFQSYDGSTFVLEYDVPGAERKARIIIDPWLQGDVCSLPSPRVMALASTALMMLTPLGLLLCSWSCSLSSATLLVSIALGSPLPQSHYPTLASLTVLFSRMLKSFA